MSDKPKPRRAPKKSARRGKPAANAPVRLHRFLSDAGVASRRRAEEMILEGRVLVNDEVVDTLPAFVVVDRDKVIVDGAVVRPRPPEYWMLHKPKGVVCTNRDPAGRTRAIDLLPDGMEHLFVVGRLDLDGSGLLLLTNDGELAERITHPRLAVPKVYRVTVDGALPDDIADRMRRGVHLSEGKVSADRVEVLHRARDRSSLEITLCEVQNRQIRRMLAKLGHKVRDLKRVRIGPLTLKSLPVGACRRLSPQERRELIETVNALKLAPRRPARPRKYGKRDVNAEMANETAWTRRRRIVP